MLRKSLIPIWASVFLLSSMFLMGQGLSHDSTGHLSKASESPSIIPIIATLLLQDDTGRFINNGDGTLTDTQTGFLWQRTDDDVQRNRDDSIAYCQSLILGGVGGWELPDIDQLFEIVDTRFTPSIDPAFTGTNASNYWSSTQGISESIGWSVNFQDGRVSNAMFTTEHFYCRCMRQ